MFRCLIVNKIDEFNPSLTVSVDRHHSPKDTLQKTVCDKSIMFEFTVFIKQALSLPWGHCIGFVNATEATSNNVRSRDNDKVHFWHDVPQQFEAVYTGQVKVKDKQYVNLLK